MLFTGSNYAEFKELLDQGIHVEAQDVEAEVYEFRLDAQGHIEYKRKKGKRWSRCPMVFLHEQFLIGSSGTTQHLARVG